MTRSRVCFAESRNKGPKQNTVPCRSHSMFYYFCSDHQNFGNKHMASIIEIVTINQEASDYLELYII